MSKKSFVYRFALGSSDGPRSSVWRVWTSSPTKSDVYVAVRSLVPKLKVSLHESGNWQASIPSESFDKTLSEDNLEITSRHLDKWHRPDDIAPGMTLALRVYFPLSDLREFPLKISSKKEIDWISIPSFGKVVEVALLFSKPNTRISGWPGKNKMNTNRLINHILPNQDMLWIVYRVVDMSQGIDQALNIISNKIYASPGLYESYIDNIKPSQRLVLGGKVTDGSYFYIEVSLDTVIQNINFLTR